MHLVILLHPHRYPTGPTLVGFVSTLSSGATLAWFVLLLEHQSPLFNDFEMFLEIFDATFGDSDKECMSSIKI
jgi:hypothetical protein